jgi:hypothetical protein
MIYSVSENSRKLFGKIAFYGITLGNIDRLFTSHGFELPEGVEPALRRELRVEQYHAVVNWENPEEVRRVLQVYQAALDEFGEPLGRFRTPQATALLKSLERDGNIVVDDEILILPPEVDIEGPLAGLTGWSAIDQELMRIKRDLAAATEANDYQAVALRSLSVLRLLSDELYDESKHMQGDEVPGPADVKGRIDHYIKSVAGGVRFEHVRKLVRDSYAQANAVKHRQCPDRIDAGVIVAATILLVEMLRMISDLDIKGSDK